jgi:hypothetical protein
LSGISKNSGCFRELSFGLFPEVIPDLAKVVGKVEGFAEPFTNLLGGEMVISEKANLPNLEECAEVGDACDGKEGDHEGLHARGMVRLWACFYKDFVSLAW